jgi:PAS domain S-box-containing protein
MHRNTAAFDTSAFRIIEALANNTSDAFLVTRAEPIDAPDGPEIVYVNPAFTRMTGFAPKDVIGATPRILQTPGTDRAELDRIRVALENWESVRATLLNQTKTGELFWVELDIVPIADPSGWYNYWAAIQRDVTDRVEEQKRVKQREKLRALGELAGGMAHEINNALQPMVGMIGLMGERLSEHDSSLAQQARTMERYCLHARNVVRDVLAFARPEGPDTDTYAVLDLLAEVTDFVSATLPNDRVLNRVGFGPDTPAVPADTRVQVSRGGLIEVMQNLIVNAMDADPDGQPIEISLAPDPPQTGAAAPPARVRIAVRDQGMGMTEQTREQVFNPFYSTKPVGQGTGMGLAVVHGFVNSWDGDIAIDTAEGAGTTIAISLPVSQE